MSDQEARAAAFRRIEELGGSGVWESEIVAISMDGTSISDDDLELFNDFEIVQILSLAKTNISDSGLVHLEGLKQLESLSLVGTKVTAEGVARLRTIIPNTDIRIGKLTKAGVNPFTGEAYDE